MKVWSHEKLVILPFPFLLYMVWIMLGLGFGNDAKTIAIRVRAPYCLKTAGAAFGKYAVDYMHGMVYKSCFSEPNLCKRPLVRPLVRPEDITRYYS